MPKLPKNAKIGTKVTRKVKRGGHTREITFKKMKPHGKNNNLMWQIVSNKSKNMRNPRKRPNLVIYLIFGAIIIGITTLVFLRVNGIL